MSESAEASTPTTEAAERRPLPTASAAETVVLDRPREQEFHVSELVSDAAGAHSPFGDLEFPLPIERLSYVHPGPDARPNLAEGH